MRLLVLFVLTILLCPTVYAQQDSLTFYNAAGERRTSVDIVQALHGKSHVFFGELHDSPTAHQAELRLLQACDSLSQGKVVLGMEMFEADVQPIVNEYFKGIINQKSFENEARIWTNYDDYRPLVEYAREQQCQLVASNVPRRYANSVYHQGVTVLDSLSDWAKACVVPLPFSIDTAQRSYREMAQMVPGHSGENMVAAQALKDATMAHFIRQYSRPGYLFLHINGAYHSDYGEGILTYLQQDIPAEQVLRISTVKQKDFEADRPDVLQKADFILVVEE